MRPLMGFNQMGIEVFHGGPAQTVGEAVQAFLNGNLRSSASSKPVAAGPGVATINHCKEHFVIKGATNRCKTSRPLS